MRTGRRTAVTPGAHAARIHVHKFGARIISHAASSQGQRRIAQSQRIDSGNANVNRMRLHVLAVFRHACRPRAKEFVAPRRAVAANNIDLRVRMAHGRGQVRQNVEHMRIVMLHVAGTMVAQKMIQLRFRSRQILIAAPVNNVNALAGVRMVKPKMVFLRRRGRRNRPLREER